MNKPEIRKLMRERRRALSGADQANAARNLANAVRALPLFSTAKDVALYLASDGEIDPCDIVALCQRLNKRVYSPYIQANRSDARLSFAPWDTLRPWVPNRYGIPEPNVSLASHRNPASLDLIFMPLVAFDSSGRRIGMGGGFYDRTLESRAKRTHWRKPSLIGIAHSFQEIASVPADSWDVPIDGILTDAGFIDLRGG